MGLFLLLMVLIVLLAGTISQFSSFGYYESTYERLTNGTAVFDYAYGGYITFVTHLIKGITQVKL